MESENQKQYELTLILSPELEDKAIDSFIQDTEKNLKDLGGSLKKSEKPEKRDLAYPIKKFQSGYYLAVKFLFNPDKLKELLETLKYKKEILRCMVNFVEESSTTLPKEERKKKPISKAGIEKVEKIKEITKEITEEEAETIKKKTKEEPKPKPEEKKEATLEDIDKKLDEILGI